MDAVAPTWALAQSSHVERVTVLYANVLTRCGLLCFVPYRDSYAFITYRYTCDAFAALENGYTLRRSNETDFELYFCGRKQFFKSNYADLGMDFIVHGMRNP